LHTNPDWGNSCVVGKVFVCRIWKKGVMLKKKNYPPKNVVWCLKMLLKGFKPHSPKLVPTHKNGPMSQFLHIFHYESVNLDEKNNDLIQIKGEMKDKDMNGNTHTKIMYKV